VKRLNYHHLLYFWTVVRRGSIAQACEELGLAPPSVSTQLRRLEGELGERLLERTGRRLVPTEMGRMVFRYADEIFKVGGEMLDALEQRPSGRPRRIVIGVDDVVPKEIAFALAEPALRLEEPVRLVFREATLEHLLADLALLALDVVLSDAPVTPSANAKVYNHPLGECGVTWMAVPELAKRHQREFPASLTGAPILLPTDDTAIRGDLDLWLEAQGVRPVVQAEFEDHALMAVFGQRGVGIFPVPSVLEPQLKHAHGLERVGMAEGVRSRFYAISVERRLRHPAVEAISQDAGRLLSTERGN
jgi:LysR family transcriptional activator of nhaA